MSLIYTNKNGRTYYLCTKKDMNGMTVYFLSRKPKGGLLNEMPSGYKIHENERGHISVRKVGKGKNKRIRNQPRPSVRPGRELCPICRAEVTHTGLKQHIKKFHPDFRPSTHVWQTVNKPVRQKQHHHSGPPMQGGKIFKPQTSKIKAESFECGWCYQPIWRVLQSNGYYRYYDDKKLTRKHKCTRPVHWRPDK